MLAHTHFLISSKHKVQLRLHGNAISYTGIKILSKSKFDLMVAQDEMSRDHYSVITIHPEGDMLILALFIHVSVFICCISLLYFHKCISNKNWGRNDKICCTCHL